MEEPVGRYEFPKKLDYDSDSPSDTSDSTTHTPYGWVESEPPSPEVFITLHDDVPPFPATDSSGVLLLFDSQSDANAEVTGGSPLEGWRPPLKTREPILTHYKRKRLFVAEEDEYGERACKQQRIEQ
jgi:hypothetical protein